MSARDGGALQAVVLLALVSTSPTLTDVALLLLPFTLDMDPHALRGA
jgi:hypothetical protein